MKRLLLFLWMTGSVSAAVSYTEFYVQTTGNNLNSGSTTDDTSPYTFADGNFTNSSGVFYLSGANLSGVTTNTWASIYTNTDTVATFISRIMAVDDANDTITVSLTAKVGTVPSDGVGNRSCKVGGAWKGPNTNGVNSDGGFPFNLVANTLTNASTNAPCINFKAGTYSTTNAITFASGGPIMFSGYSASPRDGGKAIIDGTWAGPSFIVLTLSSAVNNTIWRDLIFDHNGTTSTAARGVTVSGNYNVFERCVFRNMRSSGIVITAGSQQLIGCEMCTNNIGNVANEAGLNITSGGNVLQNLWSHHNTGGTTTHGFAIQNGDVLLNCITSDNGGKGIRVNSINPVIVNCDVYNNAGDGIDVLYAAKGNVVIQNCNFFKNGGWGINNNSGGSSFPRVGVIYNCAFGSGTYANSSGTIQPEMDRSDTGGSDLITSGEITYTANQTPWVDPANGNFTLSASTACRAGGYRLFTQSVVNSPTNTVSYPDVGAAQAASTNAAAASSEHSHVFAQ